MIVKQNNKIISRQRINGFFALQLKLIGQYSFNFVKSDGTILNSYKIDFTDAVKSSFLSIELEYSKKRKNVEIGIKNGELIKLN